MQEIKFLMLLIGSAANMDEYVFDGPMADAHVQGYLNQGFKVHTVFPGSVDQSKAAISVVYVLTREDERMWGGAGAERVESNEPQVDEESQAAFDDVVEGIKRQSTDAAMWKTPEEKAMATKIHARTDSSRFA